MDATDRAARRWSLIAGVIEDDARHRHANEFATALAGLHLVKAALDKPSPMMEEVIQRLEAQVRLERLILQPTTSSVAEVLRELCELLVATRAFEPGIALSVTEPSLRIGSHGLRTLLKLGHELTANAIKHSREHGTPVFVTLTTRREHLDLVVRNRMPAAPATKMSGGLGLLIARRMAAMLGGRVTVSRDAQDHIARVRLPL